MNCLFMFFYRTDSFWKPLILLSKWKKEATQQTFVLMKTSSRRLDQDEYVRLSLTPSEDVLKTSWRRLGQGQYIRLGYTSSRPLRDVFKTSSRRLQDVLQKRLQDIFKTFWKTSSGHLQDVFKTYHQVKLFLLTRLWEAFNTFLRRFFPKTIIYRGICPGNTTSDKFMVSVQNLQER